MNQRRPVSNRASVDRALVPGPTSVRPVPGVSRQARFAPRLLSALACLLALRAAPLLAQIVADPAAPGNQRATVITTANGVVQVNIQTPSAAGVSRNTYQQFDVGPGGAILNNSRTHIQTQTGGWVQGNPWLATGSARVILNEVNSSSPSHLRGFVEVAGQRAEVVIANPAGISVNGGGFINASGVTLTTGKPVVNNGSLESFRVERGKVAVGGLGLDVGGVDYTRILARAMEVNAGIWAMDLKATLGANTIRADSGTESPIAGTGPAPSFALDVAALGGMYAGKITLVGTEAGLGVRQAGTLAASAGDITLDVNGWISNSGTIRAEGNTALAAAAGVSQQDGGIVSARGDVRLAATQADAAISIASGSVVASGLASDGSTGSTGTLTLEASGVLDLRGEASAGGSASLSGKTVNLTQARLAARDLSLAAASGIDATQARLAVNGHLVATTAGALRTDRARIAAGRLDIEAGALSNQSGELIQTGSEAARIRVAAALDNSGGTIASNANVGVQASDILNRAGRIFTADGASLGITAMGSVDNGAKGALAASGALGLSAASLSGDGQILSVGDMDLSITGDYANNGEIAADGKLLLNTDGAFSNSGKLAAGESLDLRATHISNTASGEIVSSQTTLATSGTLTNAGLIDGQDTRIDAHTLDNVDTGRIYGDRLSIAAHTLTNAPRNTGPTLPVPVIAARNKLDLGVMHLDNREQGSIVSGDDMAIGGALDANREATGEAASIINASATIEALGDLAIATGTFTNTNLHFSTREVETGSTPVVRLLHNGVEYTQDQIATNFGPLTHYGNHPWGTILLPSAAYPFSQFPADVGSWAVPGWRAFQIAPRYTSFQWCMDCEPEVVENYAHNHPIWARFGVTPPPAPPVYGGPPCISPDLACNIPPPPEYLAALAEFRQKDEAATGELNARIADYNASVASRLLHDWTVLDAVRTDYAPQVDSSAPARILAGGTMTVAASQSAINDKSQIIVGQNAAFTGAQLQNKEAEGQARSVFQGQSVYSYFEDGGTFGDDDRRYMVSPYLAEKIRTVTLPVSVYRTQAGALAPGDTHPASFDSDHSAPSGTGIREVATAVGSDDASSAIVRTFSGAVQVPPTGLFRTHPAPTAAYLIETDRRFSDYRSWLGSDYMLNALALDPPAIQKRIGDGFYEQRLVREQVAQLTGRRFLANHSNDEAQFRALMDAGVTHAQALNLQPGIALTAAQMAQLTSDIVWLVERQVTLADGSAARVLVPQVYVRVQPGDLDGTGTLIGADDLRIDTSGDIINSGTIAGRKVVQLSAENILNRHGTIEAADTALLARQDLDNIGGRLAAANSLLATAGRDLNATTTTQTTERSDGANRSLRTGIDRVAGLYVTGNNGSLTALVGRDLKLSAAVVSSEGSTYLEAGRDLRSSTVKTEEQDRTVWNSGNHLQLDSTAEVGSQVAARDDLALVAGRDLHARAATIASDDGNTTLLAQRDVTLEAGQATRHSDEAHQIQSGGFLSRRSLTTRDTISETTAIGSEVGGRTVTVAAGRDASVVGSHVIGDEATALSAANDLTIAAAEESRSEHHLRDERKSGLFSSGSAISIGKQQLRTTQDDVQTLAAGSTVGSVEGDVTLRAGRAYRQIGSDVIAPEGDVDIAAQQVEIAEARESAESRSSTLFKQSGLSIGVNAPMLTAARTVTELSEAASKTDSSRMQALAAASAALTVAGAAGETAKAAADPDALAGGMSVSISIGSSKSESTSVERSNTAAGSKVEAGEDVRIAATGAGAASDITIRGSDVHAEQNVTMTAGDAIHLEAARSTADLQARSTSKSGSVGVSIGGGKGGGLSFGVTASASKGSGNADGADTTWTNAHVEAGKQLVIESGGDTALRGAIAKGERITAGVGGNLAIESLQDTSTYTSRSRSIGGGITVGPAPSVSFNAAKSNIDSTYASVTEQSGLKAGDEGYDVKVAGSTDLKGGVIAASDQALAEGKTRFESQGEVTMTDIANHAEYTADGLSIGFGSDTNTGKPTGTGIGVGNDAGSATGTTRSGVGVSTSADTAGAIAPIFDAKRVQDEIDAQVKITEVYSRVAPAAVATFAATQGREIDEQILGESDPDKLAELEAEKKKWGDGGIYRIVLHALVGALAGGESGALGAAATASVASQLDALQDGMQQALEDAGVSTESAKAMAHGIANLTAAGIGTAAGGTKGGAMGLAVDANNRQLHPDEMKWIRDNAKRFAQQQGISEQEAERRLAQQGHRQVQFGVGGVEDAQARAFLSQAQGMLPADPACPTCGPGYMFYATPEQRANAGMYADTLPQTTTFYQSNGLAHPTLQQIVNATSVDGTQRSTIAQRTVLAAVASGTLALAPALSSVAAEAAAFAKNPVGYCLGNLAGCTVAAEAAAYTAAGVPQPTSAVPTKAGVGPVETRGADTVADVSAHRLINNDLGPNYSVVALRGAGAVDGALPPGYITVSRWVSPEEAAQWMKNQGTAIPAGVGTPLPGTSTTTVYVTTHGAAKPGGTGPIRIDFAVPKKALNPAGNSQWSQIYQPSQSTPVYNVKIIIPDGVTIP